MTNNVFLNIETVCKITKNIKSGITIGVKETFKIFEVNVKNSYLEFEILKKF